MKENLTPVIMFCWTACCPPAVANRFTMLIVVMFIYRYVGTEDRDGNGMDGKPTDRFLTVEYQLVDFSTIFHSFLDNI